MSPGRGVSKWSRHKDRYIGCLCLDIGMVSGEFGHLPEYREVTGTPREVYGPYWAIRELRREAKRKAHKVFGKRKSKFCRVQGPHARVPGIWVQTPRTLASGPWTPQYFLLRFPKTLWAFPFGPNNVFSYPNISGNIRNPFQ